MADMGKQTRSKVRDSVSHAQLSVTSPLEGHWITLGLEEALPPTDHISSCHLVSHPRERPGPRLLSFSSLAETANPLL